MRAAVLQGSLASFKLPDVLAFLNTTRKTGTLSLSNGEQTADVYYQDGSLIYAGSNQERFRLGAILLRRRSITPEQHAALDAVVARERRRFGEVAVERGILTEDALRDALKVQVSEIIYDAFVWPGGTFSFSDEMHLPPYAVTISVDLANLIMEGARRIGEWEKCLQLLPDPAAVFRVVANPSEEKITLTADEWKVLFLINGARTLQDLCRDAADDPFNVYRVVYGLLANKLVEPAPVIDDTDEPTLIQSVPRFGTDTTAREAPDDTNLLISSGERRMLYHEVVKPVVARLRIDGERWSIPLVDPEYTIGRSDQNDIQLLDLGVSNFHARVFRGPDGFAIEDLKSRNGIWLNETRVFHAILQNGDRLRLGATEVTFELL